MNAGLSHETIYWYAYLKEGRAEHFFKHLPEQRRLRRRRGMRRHHGVRFPSHLSIAAQPDIIFNRKQIAHWECNLVQFRKEFGKASIKQAEEGKTVAEICREAGISQATYVNWKKKYSGLMPSEMR